MPVHRRNAVARLPADLAGLWVETAMVMTLRTWGLAWGTATASERSLMVDEKQPAFATAALAASDAAMAAAMLRPFDPAGACHAAAGAWSRSLTRKVRANRKRLTRPRRRFR
ncbi:MAG: hypothetical protein QOD94_1167 [Alphaproteobacteria bacterium]|nr:hypothetical protein [Alphaproteobacteria bacterium]